MRLPNGYGSVTKMSGKRRKPWRVRVTVGWTPEGKQIYKNIGTFATRKEALEALTEWNATPLGKAEKVKKEQTKQGMTFADMYNAMVQYRESKLTDSMRSLYQVAYKNLEPLHQQQFCRIKKPHLQDVFDACEKSSSTKNKMKTLVNAIYKYAIEHELAETDYSKMIDMDKQENEREYQPFSEEEIETLWGYADNGDEVAKIILIQIYTGCRIEEVLQLEKRNINLAEQYAIGGLKTEAGKDRIIPFHNRIVPLVEYFYNQDRPHLFVSKRGTRLQYRTFLNYFTDKMEEWGMEHTTHDCRRTAATRLSVADVPYNVVQQLLGHSMKGNVTNRYIYKDVKHLVKWVNVVK